MNLHQRETTLPTTRRFKPSFWRTWRPSDSWGRRTRHWMKDWPRPTPWVRMSSIKHYIRLCPCEEKKKSWFLLVSCSPGRWAPHQRGLWEQGGRDRGLPQHVGQGERMQFLSFHSLFIFLCRGRLFHYFNHKSHPDSLLVFLSLTNLLSRLPWRRWTRRCCPREKSSTP